MKITAALAAFALMSLSTQQTAGPSMPFIDAGACPFEGCTYGDWTTLASFNTVNGWVPGPMPVVVHAVFSVAPGEVFTAMTGVVVTTEAGTARMRVDARLIVRDDRFPSAPERSIQVRVGDIVHILNHQGEGVYTAWAGGSVVEFSDQTHGAIVTRPTVYWWVRIRNARGQIGWMVDPRNMHGHDMLGGPYPTRYDAFRYDTKRTPWINVAEGVDVMPFVGASGTFLFAKVKGATPQPLCQSRRRDDLLAPADSGAYQVEPAARGRMTTLDVTAKTAQPMTLRSAPSAGDEFWYVESGQIRIVAGSQNFELGAGEILLVPRETSAVRLSLRGAADARVLQCTTRASAQDPAPSTQH